MSDGAQLRWAAGDADLEGALAVRARVFCDEQGVPIEEERDAHDDQALHLLAVAPGGEVVGTLRLLFADDTVKVGRVAVDRSWRGQAIASNMLSMALAEAARRGALQALLLSQVEVVELYRRVGFEVCSEIFEQVGIPHVWMVRAL